MPPAMRNALPEQRRSRRLAILVFVVLGLAVAVNLGETAWHVRSHIVEYDPLGDFPEQEVLNEDHLVPTDSFVIIEGTKCNDSDETVTVAGEVSWQSVEPSGIAFVVLAGVGALDPGCTTETFHNPVPDEVAELAEEGLVMWKVNGTNWPIDDEGNRGSPRDFQSETFEVHLP